MGERIHYASAQLLTAPQHDYTRSLLAAVPTLRTDRTQPLAMISHHDSAFPAIG